MEHRTLDSVLDWFKKAVEDRQPIDAHNWIEAAMMMNLFLGDEQGKLFIKEQMVAQERQKALEAQNMTVAKAKVIVEASDAFMETRVLKAKIDRVIEFIRLAKVMARSAQEEFKSN